VFIADCSQVFSTKSLFQKEVVLSNATILTYDSKGDLIYPALSEWRLLHVMEERPRIKFHKTMKKPAGC